MTDAENGNGSIRFSAKQLFEKLDDRLEKIDTTLQLITIKLDTKADRADMEGVKTALAIHLASPHAAPASLEVFRAKVVGVIIGVGLVSGGAGLGIARLLKLG